MQTEILVKDHPEARIAGEILRRCVHCGFCNATCPTFVLTGNELEGPRGRIYLIKGLLEGRIDHSDSVVSHLDNCLSCLSCETTCPSGVKYSHLIDAARVSIEEKYTRSAPSRLQRKVLSYLLPHPLRLRIALKPGMLAKPMSMLLPKNVGSMLGMIPLVIPRDSRLSRRYSHSPKGERKARVALLTGCVQKVLEPRTNDATIRLLTRLGCEVVIPQKQECCGALLFHMGNTPESLPMMKNNIDLWKKEIDSEGLDYIVINSSGCGSVIKDYGHIFRNDPEYQEQALQIAGLAKDISEVVYELGLPSDRPSPAQGLRVAYHDACSLGHGQQIRNEPRELLRQMGFEVLDIPDSHLCCGSAGTYNMLKPETAKKLGRLKAIAIGRVKPQVIATGNMGCSIQIQSQTQVPVVHTVELLDWATGGLKPKNLR